MGAEAQLLMLASRGLYESWRTLQYKQHEVSGKLRDALTKSVRSTRLSVAGDLLWSVIEEGTFNRNIWKVAVGDLLISAVAKRTRPHVHDAMTEGALAAMGSESAKAAGITIRVPTQRLGMFSDEYAARVAWYLNSSSYEGAELFIDRSLSRGRSPRLIHKVIERVTLMTPRQAVSTDSYMAQVQKEHKDERTLLGRVFPLLDRQLGTRIDAFAETESMTAINFGQQIMWEEAIKRGDLSARSKKVWVTATDEKVCPICRPMDGKRVLLLEKFQTKLGEAMVPPVHPNCRCTIVPEEYLGSLGEVRARMRTRRAA